MIRNRSVSNIWQEFHTAVRSLEEVCRQVEGGRGGGQGGGAGVGEGEVLARSRRAVLEAAVYTLQVWRG